LALIGRNGAGKTNVLHALTWAAKGGVLENQPMSETNGHVSLYIQLLGKRYTYNVRRSLDAVGTKPSLHIEEQLHRHDAHGTTSIINRLNDTLLVGETGQMTVPSDVSAIRAMLAFFAGTPAQKEEVQAVSNFLDGITYYPLMPTSSSPEPNFYWWREFDAWKQAGKRTIATDTDLNFLMLDAWWNYRDKFDELQYLLGPDSLGIIDSISVYQYTPSDVPNSGYLPVTGTVRDKAEESLFSVFFTPRDSDVRVRFRQLSMGTKRVIQLLTHLIMDRISLALIEQPEDALHPAMLRKIMGIIHAYSEEFQCIVTSHSPELFNSVSPESIRLVAYEDHATTLVPLSDDQLQLAREYMEDEGSLAEFLDLL